MKAVSFHRSLKSVISENLGVGLIERAYDPGIDSQLLESVKGGHLLAFLGVCIITRHLPLSLSIPSLLGHNLCFSYCFVISATYKRKHLSGGLQF